MYYLTQKKNIREPIHTITPKGSTVNLKTLKLIWALWMVYSVLIKLQTQIRKNSCSYSTKENKADPNLPKCQKE
jgi:hypothetical protein